MMASGGGALRGWWYGPLVELADAAAHVGSYVQLLVFVLQANPSQIIKNIKNVPVNRAIILVGDKTRMYFKVVLWQLHADNDITAGDIIFLQNMKVREYKGQIEAVTVHQSTVKTLVQRATLLSFDEPPQNLSRGSCGPIVDEKLESVARWAKQTQMTLLSFLVDTPLHQDMSSPLDLKRFSGFVVSPSEHQARSFEQTSSLECVLLADAACCMKSCTMKFSAYIGEISLPFVHKEIKSATKLAFASRHLLGDSGFEFIRALLCLGCTSCDSPLDQDHNRVYIRCTCRTQALSEKGMGWIYRPFLVHVWDGSTQISILVRNKAAVKMFADIKAEDVFQSISNNSGKNPEPECTPSGAFHASANVVESTESLFQQHTRSNYSQKDAMITTDVIDKGVLLKHLLRILTSKGNHSPFHFTVSCHIDNDADVTYRYFELICFKIGPH